MEKIKTLDTRSWSNIGFCVHPPLELNYAMMDLVHEEELIQLGKDFGIRPEPEFLEMLHAMRGRLSRFLERELKYFVGSDLQHLLFVFITHYPDIADIPELIQTIESMDNTVFIRHLFGYALHENTAGYKNPCSTSGDIQTMLDVVKQAPFSDPGIAEKLTECLENPEETQQRYSLLLKQFYEKSFKPWEAQILHQAGEAAARYRALFAANPHTFFKDYLNIDLNSLAGKVTRIHVSVLEYAGAWYIAPHDELPGWVFLGAFTDRIVGPEAVKERLLKLFKGLSDGKRLDILILLGERPWYVQELAEQLDLTPATVSHHLAFLLTLGIVTCERDEHRVYYELDREKIRQMFNSGLELLVHESSAK